MEKVDGIFQREENTNSTEREDSVDLNCWTIEYAKTKKDKEIVRALHKVNKRRRMFSVSRRATHLAVETVPLVSQQSSIGEEQESLFLPTVGTVFVESEKDGKETRWVVFKLFPATMKVRARNDFNIVKTFKWPQENLKVISFVESNEEEKSFSNIRKDCSVEKDFATLDLDYKNLAKLLLFNHSRKKVFLQLGLLSKIPLDLYLVFSFKYYLRKFNTEEYQSKEVSILKAQLETFPEPPSLDIFCEFLASLTSLFDGSLKEAEFLPIYVLENEEFRSHIFNFIKLLIRQCLEVIGRSESSDQAEDNSLENHVLNVINGVIVLNNLLVFEHSYHSNFESESSDQHCYICEEWCLLEDVPYFSQFLMILQNDAKRSSLRHLSNRIREVAIEFWAFCFASNICESQVLDKAFRMLLLERNFYPYVLEPLMKRYANTDIMSMKLLQRIFTSEFMASNFFFEDELHSSQNEKLQAYLNSWLSDISSKMRKSFFSNSFNYMRLRVIYLVLYHTHIFERLLTKNEYVVSFVSAVLNLTQVTFSMLFECSDMDSSLEGDQSLDFMGSDVEQRRDAYCIIFQFLSLLGSPNVGHSIFRYILSNHFTSQRSLEKLGRVLWKLPLEVNRNMVTNNECHRYHVVNILFENYRAGNGDKRLNDLEGYDLAQDMDISKISSPSVSSETDEKHSTFKSEVSTCVHRSFKELCQQVGRMKPREFSCILEELQDFAKYVLESELMRLRGDDSKPAPFVRLKRNEYTCDYIGPIRGRGEMDKVMVCHCSSVGDLPGCVDSSCLNRASFTECHPDYCRAGSKCHNQRFQKCEYARVKLFHAGERGWGLKAGEFLPKGSFIIEYQGEVIDMEEYERRKRRYAGEKHFYFMSLDSDHMIDASRKSNMARFINHSCQPNCHTEKWTVLGEPCVGIFASRDIESGTELVFDYNVDRKGAGEESVRCYCGAPNCRNWLTGDGDEKCNERLLQIKREKRIQFLQNTLLQMECRRQDLETEEIPVQESVRKHENMYETSVSLDSIPREVKEFQIPKKVRKYSSEQNSGEQRSKFMHPSDRTSKGFAESSKKPAENLERDKFPQKHVRRSSHCKEELKEDLRLRDEALESSREGKSEPPGFGYEFLRLKTRNEKVWQASLV